MLDAPPALVRFVIGLRERFHASLAGLPVEITLTGSSGVGCLAPDTDADMLFARLEQFAAATPPLTLSFPRITRFPGSPVHYLSPAPAQALHDLHGQLLNLGLCFGETPFPFSPHLTIARFEEAQQTDREELLAVVPPAEGFVFESLSVFSQHGHDTRLHFRTRLGADR